LGSVLESLVESYNNDSLVSIATCNIAENDVPVNIYETPTVKLYPKGKKSSPIQYFGKEDDPKQYQTFLRDETKEGERLKAESRKSLSRHLQQGSQSFNTDMKEEG
jgi:hypothetical protein